MSESDSSEGEPLVNTGVIGVFPVRQSNKQPQIICDEKFEKLKQSLTCPICLRVFMEPVYIKDCSHRFCKQCIEKYIRSQERKSCPSCRKKIGTKRQLRTDENMMFMINLIFGDLSKYLKDEEDLEQLMVEQIRSANIITLKRQKSGKSNDEEKINLHRGQPRKRIQTSSVQQELPESPIPQEKVIQQSDIQTLQKQATIQQPEPVKLETQIPPEIPKKQYQTPQLIPIQIKDPRIVEPDKIQTQQNIKIHQNIQENFKQEENLEIRRDRTVRINEHRYYSQTPEKQQINFVPKINQPQKFDYANFQIQQPYYIKPINLMPTIEQINENRKYNKSEINERDWLNMQQLIQQGMKVKITIELQLLPSCKLIKKDKFIITAHMDNNLKQIQKILRENLKLQEEDTHFIGLYLKTNNSYKNLPLESSLKELNKNYWKYYDDLEIYDPKERKYDNYGRIKDFASGQRIIFYDVSDKICNEIFD